MREYVVEQAFRDEVKKQGGLALKFSSQTMNGVPDRLVLLPGGHVGFCELKAPGKMMRPLQVKRKMYMPTHCIISDLLDEDSVVLAEQITAIPKWRLRRKLCACEDAKMVADIETAVKVQLGLEDIYNEKR